MALFRCGGGNLTPTETVLWTNNSPNTDPGSQNITLSESLDNFDYIKFKWNAFTNNSTDTGQALDEVAHFKTTNAKCRIGMEGTNGTNNGVRELTYVDATTITISGGHPIGGTGGFSGVSIPTQIIGIKL